jgi:hypothetical protein
VVKSDGWLPNVVGNHVLQHGLVVLFDWLSFAIGYHICTPFATRPSSALRLLDTCIGVTGTRNTSRSLPLFPLLMLILQQKLPSITHSCIYIYEAKLLHIVSTITVFDHLFKMGIWGLDSEI